MAAQEYFQRDPERDAFYRIFYETCRRFHVTWSSASPEVKAFVEEAARVAYEQHKARRSGAPLAAVPDIPAKGERWAFRAAGDTLFPGREVPAAHGRGPGWR